jgi:hypothetical protein
MGCTQVCCAFLIVPNYFYQIVFETMRQTQNAMQMIWQNRHGINYKRVSSSYNIKSIPQTINMFRQKVISSSLSQVYGKNHVVWRVGT